MDGLSAVLNDQAELGPYVEKNMSRMLNDWSYSAGTSNHTLLGSYTHSLVKVFDECPSHSSVLPQLAQEIIRDHLKIIYRSLFLTRPRQTVPAIELLQRIAKITPDSLFNAFDMSLKVIPKLLISKDFRPAFIRFYIAWINAIGPVPKRELLHQKKIVKGWISKLSDDNNLEIVEETISCLEKSVLRNKLLTKQQKLSFFNDSTLQSFVKLLALEKDISDRVAAFLILLFTDQQAVAFPDAGWYTKDTPNNRLTLSFINMLRPWDSPTQMDIVVKLLSSFQELVYPYFDHMAKVYPFVPKTSMFWFNYSILISRAINIPVPELDALRVPSIEVVQANILPQPLTKSHLHAAVTFSDNNIVAFNAAQIALYSLRKLEKVIKIYQQNLWDSSALLAAAQDIIPAVQVFSTPNKLPLLQTTLLSCASAYYRVFETSSIAMLPTSLVNSVLEKQVTGLDKVQAQSILEIQTTVLGPTKWYNKVGDSHSFFTRLLQFMLLNRDLGKNAVQLLNYLVKPLLVMQKDTFATPVEALVYTLEVSGPKDQQQKEQLFNLIDEAISRSARAPYAYIDKFPHASPFASALAEQFAFVNGPKKEVEHWLAAYLRALQVIGEDTKQLSSGFELGELSLDDYFEFVLSAPPKKILSRDDLVLKVGTPLELMATISRISTTPEVALHLLSSIPPFNVKDLALKSCFTPILGSGNETTIQAFFSLLKDHSANSSQLVETVEASQFWVLGLDFVSAEFLERKVQEKDHLGEVFSQLKSRKQTLPYDLIADNLDQIEYLRTVDLNREDAVKLMRSCTESSSVAALVETSKFFDASIDSSPIVLLAASKYAPDYISGATRDSCTSLALSLLDSGDNLVAISLFCTFSDSIPDHSVRLSKVLDSAAANPLVPDYAKLNCYINNKVWINSTVLRLTKFFSESSRLEAGYSFIMEFTRMLESVDIWAQVSSSSINALVSSLIKRIELGSVDILLKFLNGLVVNAKGLSHTKHLHKLLEMEPGFFENKLLINLVFWRLFNCDSTENTSWDTQVGVLRHFGGLAGPADALLIDILQCIEENLGASWADNVVFWELQSKINLEEYDRPALITTVERGTKLQVTLCEDLIVSSTDNFDPGAGQLAMPKSGEKLSDTLARFEEYEIIHPSHGYNDEFLLGCIASCDQLVQDNKLDVKTLSEMRLFAFVLCSLCSLNPNVSSMAQMLLEAASASIVDEKYKEATAVTLVVNKALMFLSQTPRMPPHIAIILGQIANIATTPNHFLHEKVSNWLLSGPSIQSFDLPLYSTIIESESPAKPQELLWIVKSLTKTLVDEQVAALYVKLGVFEWAYAQLATMSAKSNQLKNAVRQFLNKAKLTGISDGLVRRNGALSYDPDFMLFNTSSGVFEWMGYA